MLALACESGRTARSARRTGLRRKLEIADIRIHVFDINLHAESPNGANDLIEAA